MSDRASRPRRRALASLRTLAGSNSSARSLRRRVAELETEMQEARRLNRRLAELMDVVEELLVPLSQRDEERVRRYLSSNTTALGGDSSSGTGSAIPSAADPVGRDESSGTR